MLKMIGLEFINVLRDTERFYTNDMNYSNGINDNRINARIDLLSERIVHYQQSANDTINWWIAILSILVVFTNAISLYNYNEGKKELDRIFKRANELNTRQKNIIDIIEKKFASIVDINCNIVDGERIGGGLKNDNNREKKV